MSILRTLLPALAAGAFASLALARPTLVEETAVLANPDPVRYRSFGGRVATNGTDVLALATDKSNDELWIYYLLRFQRVAGSWVYRGEVLRQEIPNMFEWSHTELAMRGDLVVAALEGPAVAYRLTDAGLVKGETLCGNTNDIEIDGSRVACGEGEAWNGSVSELNADGTWTHTFLPGQPRQPDDENWGGPIDLDQDRVIIGTPQVADLEPQEIPIYQRTSTGSWQLQAKLQVPAGAYRLGGPVALKFTDAIVDAYGGPYVWWLGSPGQAYTPGEPTDRLQSIDEFSPLPFADPYPDIEKSELDVLVQRPSGDHGGTVINVFAIGPSERYERLATLAAKNGVSIAGSFDSFGNTVVAHGGDGQVHVFELPTAFGTSAPQYDNFENGASQWTPQSGAQFAIAASGTNHVYRQSSVAGDARAILGNANWRDQAIEADIRPTQFSGNDRWVGLITRYQDAQNFWYVTLRSSGSVALRRIRGGTVTELARAPLAVAVNRSYRVRLETVGTEQRVYVDGKLLLEADDGTSIQSGSAGLAMYRARADFDNVMVTPSRHTTILARDFPDQYTIGPWTLTGAGQWSWRAGSYAQDSTAGDARAAGGTPTDDQIVEARVQPTAYAAASGSQERWTGILARYRDAQNYYYLTLRSSNTVSLRKLVNGAITPLASAPFAVNLNTPHTLRLEAVGNQLRGYVDGVLVVQATDTSHASGSGGLVTYKAAATFDDYVAYQP